MSILLDGGIPQMVSETGTFTRNHRGEIQLTFDFGANTCATSGANSLAIRGWLPQNAHRGLLQLMSRRFLLRRLLDFAFSSVFVSHIKKFATSRVTMLEAADCAARYTFGVNDGVASLQHV